MKKYIIINIISVLCIFFITSYMKNISYIDLGNITVNSVEFRNMNFSEDGISDIIMLSETFGTDIGETACVVMMCNNFNLAHFEPDKYSYNKYLRDLKNIKRWYSREFVTFSNIYGKLLKKITYFPVPKSTKRTEWVYYSDSFGADRTYGGERQHEGTDIMTEINERGLYPLISISSGQVKAVGWLTLGGYRLLIGDDELCFYYAHMASYAKEYKEGDIIKAGDFIGYTGDTGYSEIPGTTGNFDVHLHLGIYIYDDEYGEISVNPYWILRFLEKNTVSFVY